MYKKDSLLCHYNWLAVIRRSAWCCILLPCPPASLQRTLWTTCHLRYLTRTDSAEFKSEHLSLSDLYTSESHSRITISRHVYKSNYTCSKGHQLDPNLTLETFSIPVQSCAEELWGRKVCFLRLRCHLLLIARVNILMHTLASYGLKSLDLLLESNFDEPNH